MLCASRWLMWTGPLFDDVIYGYLDLMEDAPWDL